VSVVGVWRIEADGNNKVLVVDGRQWKEGQTSAGIADKARALYGDRYAEFLDRVQAYAYFPYAVAKEISDFRNGELAVRFEGISGRIDQGAGILFNLKQNGDYLTIRANPLENNLVLWIAPASGTGIFVPDWGKLFVSAHAQGKEPAKILVYETK
jgi:hypothetical protein